MKQFLFLIAVFALAACKPEPEKTVEQPAEQTAPAAPATIGAIPLPPEMLFNGQPIDPMCFQLSMTDDPTVLAGPVALNNCRTEDIVVSASANMQPDAQALIGYEYGYKSADGSEPSLGAFAKYRYLGQVAGHHVILSVQSGGGSGVFTALSSFDRVGDTVVRVRDYAAGDRCNGGVKDARVGGGKLAYTVNLTPPDILDLTLLADQMIPYEDLEASASSCFATAAYEDGRFVDLKLDATALQDRLGWTGNYKYQACFNSMARSYVEMHQAVLETRRLTRFGEEFKATCLGR